MSPNIGRLWIIVIIQLKSKLIEILQSLLYLINITFLYLMSEKKSETVKYTINYSAGLMEL